MRSLVLGFFISLPLFFLSCTKYENVIPSPAISVSNEMINEWDGCLQGQTLGVDPHLYHLAIYASVDDLWYSLPSNELPRTVISDENQWICQTEKLDIDHIGRVQIYLLPNRFNPPALVGEKSLPVKLNLVCVAKRSLTVKERMY